MKLHFRHLSLLCPLAVPLIVSSLAAAAPVVDAFPTPDSRSALPATQIAFRGAPISALGAVTVTGSRSGTHAGRLVSDSDGQGGSFLPSKPFIGGETVTVASGVTVAGATGRTFQFATVTPAGPIGSVPLPFVKGRVQSFRSRTDLKPPAVRVTRLTSGASAGDLFTAPQAGPMQNGPIILDGSGQLVWFNPVPMGQQATDVRVQTLAGKPVLTWWQGVLNLGLGTGEDVIEDTSYRRIATVRGANGLKADLHEFQLTNRGTALITAYSPVRMTATGARGARSTTVVDSVVQEIDIPTGLVLFEWHSLDRVELNESYVPVNVPPGTDYDYFHVNSVDLNSDGNLLISARNTWSLYKVDHGTGQVIWRLGGKRSSFHMGRGATFAFQHDARQHADNTITVFDDGALPKVHSQSRGLRLALDLQKMTATVVHEYDHSAPLLSGFEGNMQQLPNGGVMLGWGPQPYFTEFDAAGRTVFDAHFLAATPTYRVYRLPWTAQPVHRPRIAVARDRRAARVWASWNGATTVYGWQILRGTTPTTLRLQSTIVPKRGFETSMIAHGSGSFFAVRALGSNGRVLAISAPVELR